MAKRSKIDVDNLPSNNKRAPNAQQSIVSGRVRVGGDAVSNRMREVGNSIFDEVVLPTLKTLLFDAFTNGLSMLIYRDGDSLPSGRGRGSYNRMYRPRRGVIRDTYRGSGRRLSPNRYVEQTEEVFKDLYFDRKSDAEIVLAHLFQNIEDYGQAKVGDYYAIAGKDTNYTQQAWGWTDLSGTRIHYTTDGYVIGLPDPIYFN